MFGCDYARAGVIRYGIHASEGYVYDMTLKIPFDNSYARLPDAFFARQSPVPVRAPRMIAFNDNLAKLLRISPGDVEDMAEAFAGNSIPEGAEPIAQLYSGHQFGQYNPQLGDGRAVLLGETVGTDGVRRDIQLKGSGPTPFSRRGDGRAGWGRCCGNMWYPRRCMPWHSGPHVPWQRWKPARPSFAKLRCPERF